MGILKKLGVAAVAALLLPCVAIAADSFRRGGTELNAMRAVSVPAAKAYSIAVTEFFHHGEIAADGRNVVVATRREQLVPMRILQLGPGDFCRLAFQTVSGQDEYEVFYGGNPPAEPAAAWTARDGLLLETRRYQNCNLNSLESVRKTFESAPPIGADYVDNVHHAGNPFSPGQEPFLSRYSGYLQIASAGKYGFIPSSQDCSFLVIDDKLVASAPGRHPPLRRARPGTRGDVQLAAGPHKFEYYHAAAGGIATMALAWEVHPRDSNPQQPAAVPSEAFGTRAVAHLPTGHLSLRSAKLAPDFVVKLGGEVPLPDNNVPLIAALFRDVSPKALSMGSKVLWEFGDGQTSDKLNTDHVYLHPGVYTVKLSFRRGGAKAAEIANHVCVDRPTPGPRDKTFTLDDYLPMLEAYDPHTLDAAGLRQLVLCYEVKALALQAQAEQYAQQDKMRAEDPNRKTPERKEPPKGKSAAAEKVFSPAERYYAMAVKVGRVAFVEESAAKGDEELVKLAQIIGPMARDLLGESEVAFQIWKGAAERIGVGDVKAECEAEAADVAINDLVNPHAAKALLDAAAGRLGKRRTGAAAGKVERVWGDYYALGGDGNAARKAYGEAERILGPTRRYIERTAWRGAHSRSTEEFIRQGQLDRAAAEIRAWQREFPEEKIDGYLTLMYAKYWAAREKYPQAVAQAEQLTAVNRDSPYIDQVLVLAADCELKRGRTDRALATLHSLVKDYPGSPLVPEVKKTIARLESGQPERPKKPPARKTQ
jgi:TolA-binding protein